MFSIVQSIAPFILIILIGYVSGASGLLSSTFRKGLSDFCYYFGMPALLIKTIGSAPTSSTAAHLIWAGYLLPVALVWLLAAVYSGKEGKLSPRQGASVAMASAYGNVIMLGIPLALTQFGQASATTVAFIVLVHSPVMFLAAAVHAELAEGRTKVAALAGGTSSVYPGGLNGANLAHSLREVSAELVTNPIIIGIFVGLSLRLGNLSLPSTVGTALSLLGQATLPCVLLAIGLGLSEFKLKGKLSTIGVISFLKLVVLPLAAWLVTSYVLRLPPIDVGVITLMAAMPTGANAYVFASRGGGAEASVSGAVALSTIASAVTITIVLATLGASPG